jgi:hypothetical protein
LHEAPRRQEGEENVTIEEFERRLADLLAEYEASNDAVVGCLYRVNVTHFNLKKKRAGLTLKGSKDPEYREWNGVRFHKQRDEI